MSDWDIISEIVVYNSAGIPQQPIHEISKDQFYRVWSMNIPTWRIHKIGSEFCDSCAKLRNMYDTMTYPTTNTEIWRTREHHRHGAFVEFKLYRKFKVEEVKDVQGPFHLTLYIAENVSFPISRGILANSI